MRKLKEILLNINSYILTGIFSLGCIILYVGIDKNINFVWIGLLILLPFAIWFLILKFKSDKIEKETEIEIEKLIQTGDKIIINLDEVEIQTNSYKQEISVGNGTRQRNEYIDVNHNVILLEIPYKNELIKYKLNIDMDPTKLKMHFAIKEKTELYVDAENPNNNYLDLRFLES